MAGVCVDGAVRPSGSSSRVRIGENHRLGFGAGA
jgi:hypothetical protein